jgi:hypothetical protein
LNNLFSSLSFSRSYTTFAEYIDTDLQIKRKLQKESALAGLRVLQLRYVNCRDCTASKDVWWVAGSGNCLKSLKSEPRK